MPASDGREGCTIKRTLVALSLTLALLVAGLLPAAAVAGQPITGTKLSLPGGSYRAVTPRELAALIARKHFLLVNVHYPYAGELPRTDRFIPSDTIGQHLSSLPANKHAMIMRYCRSGRMSDIAARWFDSASPTCGISRAAWMPGRSKASPCSRGRIGAVKLLLFHVCLPADTPPDTREHRASPVA